MNRFSERLRYLRKINGVTQAELSRYLGYGYTAVSNYENAEHQPDYNTLMKIAEYFNVLIDFLMGADDCMEQMRCIPEEMDMLQEYRKLKTEEKNMINFLIRYLVR